MALTPEDVVNKRFQPTKFREGYDQDEVDDFLDEVVVELRRLNQENVELREQLAAGGGGVSEPQSAPAPVIAEQQVQPAAVAPTPAPAATPEASNADDTAGTNNLLQLARRLHEEHVREGVEKRDALIAEGHATAARVVAEAESKQRAQIGALDQERGDLEHRIEELRSFERDYRAKLKNYIESQLHDLDGAGVNSNSGGYASKTTASGQMPAVGQPGTGSVPASQPPTFQGFGA